MYLYLVTCVYKSVFTSYKETYQVYVVAENPTKASEAALDLMRALKYKYGDYVENVEILASVNTYRANALLVLP